MVRNVIFLVASAVLGAGLIIGVLDLPAGGTADQAYARALVGASIGQHALNTVSGVLFDLRAMDTLGEALALFAAAAALQLALGDRSGERRREQPRRQAPGRAAPSTSDAVHTIALVFVPPVAALAAVVTLRGHLSVGGGLQGGALGLAALALVFLAGRYRGQRRLAPDRHLDVEEAVGAGGYVLVGLLGLVVGGHLLENVLPLGTPGQLLSAGAVMALGLLVAIEARAALLLIVAEIQEEPLEREEGA
jgi:multicomponent Na+:H+ antiporter subunit B